MKAHAGAGKSITLRRVAWEAAKTYDKLVFFLAPSGSLDIHYLEEIVRLTNRTIYLFLDDAGDRVDELIRLLNYATSRKWSLILIGAERVNEWNIQARDADSLV